MSVRLEAYGRAGVPPEAVWRVLIDWVGQGRWIPFTSVRVVGDRATGIGTRCDALSGIWLGRLPLGLLDRFVVTSWTPPAEEPGGSEVPAELEILHLGPYFTGPGTFRLTRRSDGGTDIACTELFDLPGGAPLEAVVRLGLPIMRRGFEQSLSALATIAEADG